MRAVVQRVTSASVSVDGTVVGEIGPGLLALVGVTHADTDAEAVKLARKIAGLRILRDGARDESAADAIGAPVLVVSQFTLYGDASAGRRPSWQAAAPGAVAEPLVAAVVAELRRLRLPVHTGRFGAMMAVASVNDGPFTVLLEV
ncbi:MAG TPA: D-aminoacyl-tRNA deacylase [Jatrophihabitans sp.]|nr:D-aminoacyl-tRNA deacylase [Jatrophihabitans sp.]